MSEVMEFHPAADIFPLMEGEEFDSLVADIKSNGLREKMDLYEGKIVDGRNRYRALKQLGIDPSADRSKYFRKAVYTHAVGGEIKPHEQNNDDRVRAYVISKNIHRRHLTAEQRRDLIGKLLEADPSKSDRQIGEMIKADHKTVGTVRAHKEATGEISPVEKRVGADGKRRKLARKSLAQTASRDAPVENIDKIPTEEEAEESYQQTLYDQACLLLESMTDSTRQKFFAHIKRKYPSVAAKLDRGRTTPLVNAVGKPYGENYDPNYRVKTPLTSIKRQATDRT